MDSMRSLNTSLPSASPSKRQTSGHSPELMQAFRAAASSVTNLYKTAILDQSEAHSSGYQDAIEDLLSFLDKENIGVGEGEGRRIRQWATERLERTPGGNATSDSDEDAEEENRARSSSPIMQRKTSGELSQEILQPQQAQQPRNTSPVRPESAPPMAPEPPTTHTPFEQTLPAGDFTFRSAQAFPSADMDVDGSEHQTRNSSNPPSVRIEVKPRRSSGRNANNQRNLSRSSTNNLGSLGPGAGSKRRIQINDLFDITGFPGFGNGKDRDAFGGGGKRSRFT